MITYLMKNTIIKLYLEILIDFSQIIFNHQIINSIMNKFQTQNSTNLIIITIQKYRAVCKIFKYLRSKHQAILQKIKLLLSNMSLQRNNNLLNKIIKQICMSHYVDQLFLDVKDVKWQSNQIQHNQLVTIVIIKNAQKSTSSHK